MQLKSISARWVKKTKTVSHVGVMVSDINEKHSIHFDNTLPYRKVNAVMYSINHTCSQHTNGKN